MTHLSKQTLDPWFRLTQVQGIGNYLFKRLIDRFASPEAVFAATDTELATVEGMGPGRIRLIRHARLPDDFHRIVDHCRSADIHILHQKSEAYPALLLTLPDPPPLLYVKGDLDHQLPAVSIVGSRNATPYGKRAAYRLGTDLARNGISVVSGMARGIDTAAHMGALDAGGHTVGVLGCGVDRIYPPENRGLFDRITRPRNGIETASGALISEFPLGTEPEAHHFPLRNRIICGMTHGTVVVEAARRSGSLITARLAAEQGREVFAVPGSIGSATSSGTHGLLKQGAKLVEHVDDILEELTHVIGMPPGLSAVPETPRPDFSPDEQRVWDALSPYPAPIDHLIRATGFDPGKLTGLLLAMELAGHVIAVPGKQYYRNEA
ncbi:MAG: DNA-protecting protein DprA [Deltaproteobacteria bacterium]|nr:MAG: DNA-protecting protein DprA [Deltaproteobacteria bacterium]